MKVTQLCSTLYDPTDYTVHGILQARILEWVAFPFSTGVSSQLRDRAQVSCITGRFFTNWATREAQSDILTVYISLRFLRWLSGKESAYQGVWSMGRSPWEGNGNSNVVAWEIPWTEEPGALYSPRGRKESDKTERVNSSTAWIFLEQTIQVHARW